MSTTISQAAKDGAASLCKFIEENYDKQMSDAEALAVTERCFQDAIDQALAKLGDGGPSRQPEADS